MPELTLRQVHALCLLKAEAKLPLKAQGSGQVAERGRVKCGDSWLRTLRSKESFSVGREQRCHSQRNETVSVKYEISPPLTNAGAAAAPVHAGCLRDSWGFILAAGEANGKLESIWGRDFP